MSETVFDPEFYSQRYGVAKDRAFAHFQAEGDSAGLDPSPYFSTIFYKQRFPDWHIAGAPTALADFLDHAQAGRHRQPHPLIDGEYYLDRYPDLAGLGGRAALHFITHGDQEVRTPSAAFDATFYQRCYLALDQRRPFHHYVTQGRERGYLARPVPRTTPDSAATMAAAMQGLPRPFLLSAHDAQPAGVPLATLDIAADLAGRGWQPVFLLDRAGPLIDRFRDLGPVRIAAEGWDLDGLACALPAGTPVVVNTGAAGHIARAFAAAGHRTVLLIHEMADYLHSAGLMPDLIAAKAAGARLVVSMPRTATAVEPELGPLPVLVPGIVRHPAPLTSFRKVRAWRGQTGPVFISAGYADHRKGFDLFLQAATEIKRQCPTARFVWLGEVRGWARDLADAALAEDLDLTLPGFAQDALAWYRRADAYLLTSRQDPGPTTVVHAAAVGTPFVAYATDIGIQDMASGIGVFHQPGDVAGFVTTALRLAKGNTPASRRIMRRLIASQTSMPLYVDGILRHVPDP